ncbi:MAG: hypothetical protein ABW032_03515 [Burkholderiaceae bacterium]
MPQAADKPATARHLPTHSMLAGLRSGAQAAYNVAKAGAQVAYNVTKPIHPFVGPAMSGVAAHKLLADAPVPFRIAATVVAAGVSYSEHPVANAFKNGAVTGVTVYNYIGDSYPGTPALIHRGLAGGAAMLVGMSRLDQIEKDSEVEDEDEDEDDDLAAPVKASVGDGLPAVDGRPEDVAKTLRAFASENARALPDDGARVEQLKSLLKKVAATNLSALGNGGYDALMSGYLPHMAVGEKSRFRMKVIEESIQAVKEQGDAEGASSRPGHRLNGERAVRALTGQLIMASTINPKTRVDREEVKDLVDGALPGLCGSDGEIRGVAERLALQHPEYLTRQAGVTPARPGEQTFGGDVQGLVGLLEGAAAPGRR